MKNENVKPYRQDHFLLNQYIQGNSQSILDRIFYTHSEFISILIFFNFKYTYLKPKFKFSIS